MALQQKKDATGNGASDEYEPAGWLKKHIWARGGSATHAHNWLGGLTGIDYSDATRGVTLTHGARGRVANAGVHTGRTHHYEVEARADRLAAHSFRKRRSHRSPPGMVYRNRLAANHRIVLLGPFGEPLRATGAMAEANSFRWSTRFCDRETGLCYYGYRYYSPSTGRWLSRDPAGEYEGLNLMAFVANQPITLIDVDGRGIFGGRKPATLSYVTTEKKSGLCGAFNWKIDWRVSGTTPVGAEIFQKIRIKVNMKNADGDTMKSDQTRYETFSLSGSDRWLWPMRPGCGWSGKIIFEGDAYVTDKHPSDFNPTSPLEQQVGGAISSLPPGEKPDSMDRISNKVNRKVTVTFDCKTGFNNSEVSGWQN